MSATVSSTILTAIAAGGWARFDFGGNVIARKDGHELDISPNRFAHYRTPGLYGDSVMVEGVRAIVTILREV